MTDLSNQSPLILISTKKRRKVLFLILLLGCVLFAFQLGTTGLVDETPPLFAAAGRAMAFTGDWLTPRVNGLPRFDKPPLIYWLMGALYSLPFQQLIDPLGTWAARLPSALSIVAMMMVLGDTVIASPQRGDEHPGRTAIVVSLAFGLSPLVMLWGRTAVSDALLCSTLGLSLLSFWKRYANPQASSWWQGWFFLGLAVLTKGPVAFVLTGLTLGIFCYLQSDFKRFWQLINPFRGLLLLCLISVPWYLLELIVEGQPFWDSFFGYHNFQRLTTVVNSHLQPWWYFFPVAIISSLPFTPLLFLGVFKTSSELIERGFPSKQPPQFSLKIFSFCWLVSVLFLFTCAATKLPSYWLPATPAAAILIGLAFNKSNISNKFFNNFFWNFTLILLFSISLIFLFSFNWVDYIDDPEMPSLAAELLASKFLVRASLFFAIAAILGIILREKSFVNRLIAIQIPLIFFHLFVYLPVLVLGDELRHLPVRQAANLIIKNQRANEPIAMVGRMKPSLHFYTRQVVVYEGRSAGSLVNLVERLREEKRQGWSGRPINGINGSQTALIVIDQSTSRREHWDGLLREELGQFGIYKVWRVDRDQLEKRARKLASNGINTDWKDFKQERF